MALDDTPVVDKASDITFSYTKNPNETRSKRDVRNKRRVLLRGVGFSATKARHGWLGLRGVSHEEFPTLSGAHSNEHGSYFVTILRLLRFRGYCKASTQFNETNGGYSGEMLHLGIGLIRASSSSCCLCLPRSPVICKL